MGVQPPKKPKKQQKQHVCSNSLFLDVSFSGVFGPMGPLWIFIRLGKLQVKLTSSQRFPTTTPFFGDQKRTKHGKLGSPPLQKAVDQKTPQVFWFWCHFTRCQWSIGGVRSWGKSVRDRSWGIDTEFETRWDGPNLRGILKQQKRLAFCFQIGERLKKITEILESVNCFFFFFVVK